METNQEKYLRALDRVKQIKKLYSKIINSLILVALIAGVNYYVNELRNPWFLWVAGFSFLGIVIETFKVYGTSLFLGKGWERRKIKEQMEKEDQDTKTNFIRK
ncbi:2TM domain-containing protein [Dokdonia sp. Hel_I_53]|uniref:2TM domain-containing protein n=1 Tax=Dokdonia sp. Hel_I_53 TaxID=1566287 RepID=UPI00119C38E3|nr:2TM domain-containing protein [Dokdonia sp. Hel_I_53]TVZ51137.1 2TM domain-containing protein [Dokdonia sp. Hel_I_53]